ncbi:MAG: hypothetical protein ACLUVQ_05980 [Agathobacter rectalis]|jgi:hypothetical protein
MMTGWSMQVDYSNDFYPKIPFYMTYPMQSMYLTEMEYEKDMERMKQYYPAETKEIMELVEQRLDQLEYEGSRIYDEEPDRLMIQMEIDGIYRKLSEVQKKKENRIEGNMQAASYFEMVPASIAGETMTTQERECGNPWLCSMIGVLFGAEMCKRRCRHRRCRRWM